MQVARVSSNDIFRGIAILTMVLANFMTGIRAIPAWLKHAPDIGLTSIDFIAPFFIFAIRLTYRPAFMRRLEREGALQAYNQLIGRYFAILGMGAIITSAGTALEITPGAIEWGVLQAIGVAGLMTLPVIRLPTLWRWIIGFGLLTGLGALIRDADGKLDDPIRTACSVLDGHDQRLLEWIADSGLVAMIASMLRISQRVSQV